MINSIYKKQLKIILASLILLLGIVFLQNFILNDYFKIIDNKENELITLKNKNTAKIKELQLVEKNYNEYKIFVENINKQIELNEKYKINFRKVSLDIKDFIYLFNKIHKGNFSLTINNITEDLQYTNILEVKLKLNSNLNIEQNTINELKKILLIEYKNELNKYKKELSMLDIKIIEDYLLYRYINKI